MSEREFADSLTPTEAQTVATDYCRSVFEKAAIDVAQNLGIRFGWKVAVQRLLTRNNAAVARFASDDDRHSRSGE